MVVLAAKTDRGFHKLLVWQRAHRPALLIYELSGNYPKSELFGLTSQMRRSAVSVPANIAEGYAAGGKRQFARYLNIAQGSLAEAEYYLLLARDLKYNSEEQYQDAENLRGEVGFLLHRLIQSLGK